MRLCGYEADKAIVGTRGGSLGIILVSSLGKLSWKSLVEIYVGNLSWKTLLGNTLGNLSWETILKISLENTSLKSLLEISLGNLLGDLSRK